jgi:hypothetical protein
MVAPPELFFFGATIRFSNPRTSPGQRPKNYCRQFRTRAAKISRASGLVRPTAGTKEGNLYTWAANYVGSTGQKVGRCIPAPKFLMDNVACVASGEFHSMCMTKNGDFWIWGYNSYGEVAAEILETSATILLFVMSPVKLKISEFGAGKISGFGCGDSFSYLIADTGDIFHWGTISSEPPSRCQIPGPFQDLRWVFYFRWLFLGRSDENSEFFSLPVEVLYHIVSLD